MYVVGHFLEPFIGESLAVRIADGVVRVAHDTPHGQVIAGLIPDGLEAMSQHIERQSGTIELQGVQHLAKLVADACRAARIRRPRLTPLCNEEPIGMTGVSRFLAFLPYDTQRFNGLIPERATPLDAGFWTRVGNPSGL